MKVTWFNTVDSTNSEALRRLPSLPSETVLAAREQTSGRGQRGNRWLSAPGQNLTFSAVLKFPDGFLAAADAFLLNALCSLSVVDFLSSFGVAASVKWPNDIYVRGRKICGMLLENGLSGGSVAYSVMGFGINVFQTEFPDLVNATSLARCAGEELGGLDLVQCLERFLSGFSERLSQLDDSAGRQRLLAAYEGGLYRRGVSARFHDLLREEEFEGVIRGVEADGRLCIADASGALRRFRFKEVSYVL